MTRTFDAHEVVGRYSKLGMLANPFFGYGAVAETAAGIEVSSESNILLREIALARTQDAIRPIWVDKSTSIPSSYHLSAESRVEEILAQDESFGVLHAYVPLFSMKSGAVRSTLGLLSERLVFRGFDETLALYIDRILDEPDESLTSYQVLGPEGLSEFAKAFAEDRLATVHAVLGTPDYERKPELAQVADWRVLSMEGDVDEAPDDIEIDNTVGEAPGIALALPEEETQEPVPFENVADYLIEYTREHLSPVIGRAIRVYQSRGLTATAAEFKITKAPRKTLAAVAKLARVRYQKLVVMYDGFENWLNIDAELRGKIVGLLSEIRWSLADDAVMVYLIQHGAAPEVEETFSSGTKLTWDFPGLLEMEAQPGAIIDSVVDRWLANAAAPGADPLTTQTPVVREAIDAAEGDVDLFTRIAATAVEIAADQEATTLTSEHVSAALEELKADEVASETDAE
ncbi:MAG: hypothetical protein HGB10_05535 [Coriobacteriia bacterium]|nr:hypothetical protein [Coriobacteriia bacterium]